MAAAALLDVEAFLVARLKADAGALHALVGDRISTELPKSFPGHGEKRLQLFRVGGVPDPGDGPGHLDRPSVQLNAYGTTKAEAFDVAQAALGVVLELEGTAADGIVVTRAFRNLGPTWSPDPAAGAPRYLLGVILNVHAG
jgi:hypothetical protein